jgi:hypothetical protein
MRRRTALAALGSGVALLAGCLETDESPGGGTTTAATTTNGDVDATRQVAVADTATVPSDAGLSVTASMERERVTSAATALLTVEVENTGAARATDVQDAEYCHPFDRFHGGSNPAGLWLYRSEDAPTREGDRWTQDINPGDSRTFVDIGCGRQPFAAGASVTVTYEVWDDYESEGYLPPGSYRFETSIPLWDAVEDDGDPRVVDWWLELDVS